MQILLSKLKSSKHLIKAAPERRSSKQRKSLLKIGMM